MRHPGETCVIDAKFALDQIERMGKYHKFPERKREVDELKFALMASANEKIAIDVINHWVSYSEICPLPSQVRRQVWEENEKIKPQQSRSPVHVSPAIASKQAAAAERYMELIGLQREERRLNPKLAEIGPDGMCPRTALTQEMESKWAEAGMGHR